MASVASTSSNDGSGASITAPWAVTSTVTVAPSLRWVHRPGPRTQAVPRVGWPAKASSAAGVKMRTSYSPSATTTGNAVSDRFTSRASAAMTGGGTGSSTTHRALPANGRSVNTSTIR